MAQQHGLAAIGLNEPVGTGPLLWKYEGGVWVAKWADGETPE